MYFNFLKFFHLIIEHISQTNDSIRRGYDFITDNHRKSSKQWKKNLTIKL
jgi:hypothetical protein